MVDLAENPAAENGNRSATRLDVLIHAWRRIVEICPRARLLLIGPRRDAHRGAVPPYAVVVPGALRSLAPLPVLHPLDLV